MEAQSNPDQKELLDLLLAKEQDIKYNKIKYLFPDSGPYRRELYPKHVDFLNAGAHYSQRAFIAANRSGKTLTACYEMACHLTGEYPSWWKGKRFYSHILAWAAGINNATTKEILQRELVGEDLNDYGTGLIPRDKIIRFTRKMGATEAIESVYVRHKSGGVSQLVFKAYEQGRKAFQGNKVHVILLDEEPFEDPEIYGECLTRTMDEYNPGIIICSFTPLVGLSDVVLKFLPDGVFPKGNVDPRDPYKYVTQVTWDDVPHLSEQQKKEMLSAYDEHERDARSKGLPGFAEGRIYPYPEEEISIDPIPIPEWWPRGYGLDVGWNRTAAVWVAFDPMSTIYYIYSEHYEAKAVPAVHASAIKSRDLPLRQPWMVGAIDPAASGMNASDGRKLIEIYEQEGLLLEPADNTVEAGIMLIKQLFESKRIRVFNTCENFFREYRLYRKDKDGKIVKENDHLMDAMRYFFLTGINFMKSLNDAERGFDDFDDDFAFANRNKYTGY